MELIIFGIILISTVSQQCLYTDQSQTNLLNTLHQYKISTNCYPCLAQCKLCSSQTDKTCKNGNCQISFFYSTIENQCKRCMPLCENCNNQIQCTKCIEGYYLINKECKSCLLGVKQCPGGTPLSCFDSFYYNSNTFSCKKCQINCANCSNNQCNLCNSQYYLNNNGNCEKCLITNCSVCSTVTQCMKCLQGYKLIDNTCQKYICEPNCIQCQNGVNNSCLLCSFGYLLYNNRCYYGSSFLCQKAFGTTFGSCQQCAPIAYKPSLTETYCILKTELNQSIRRIYLKDFELQLCRAPYLSTTQFNSVIIKTIKIKPSFEIKFTIIAILQNSVKPLLNPVISMKSKNQLISKTISNSYPVFCSNSSLTAFQYIKIQMSFRIQTSSQTLNVNFSHPSSQSMAIKEFMVELSLCRVNNCISCISSLLCILCNSPYLTEEYQCVIACSDGYFTNSQLKTCQIQCSKGYYIDKNSFTCNKCQTQCLQCSAINICQKCSNGYFLDNGKCLSQCSRNITYPSIATNTCELCDNPCKTCSILGNNCTSCQIGYLYKYSCFQNCPQGYFETFQNNSVCLSCSSNCFKCFIKDNLCSECYIGMFLLEGICVNLCPNGYYPQDKVCKKCKNPCLECTNKTNCTKCLIGNYFLTENKTGQCIKICPVKFYSQSNECKACPTQCIQCISKQICTKCTSSLYLQNGICKLRCTSGYMSNLTNKCQKCQYPCNQCEIDYLGNNCKNCLEDYNLNKVSKKCNLLCEQGFYSNNRICQPCTQFCLQCDSLIVCRSCQSGFILNQGMCGSGCLDGQFYNGSQCSLCSFSCLTCIDSASNCTSCKNGQYLYTVQKRCVISCPIGYLMQKNTMQCKVCDSMCLQCENATNSCLSCYQNTYFYNYSCLPTCPIKFYPNKFTLKCENCPAECEECISLSQCSKCIPNTYFYNNFCYRTCILGYYESTNTCQKCLAQCLACKNNITCQNCIFGFYLQNNLCGISCLNGTFPNSITNTCEQCLAPCVNCINLERCLSCTNGSILHKQQCLISCPTGYYLQSNQCLSCIPSCRSCRSLNNCTECSLGYFEYNNVCQTNCPNLFYKSFINNKCLACEPPCVNCTEIKSCLSCIDSFLLIGNLCINNCPSGYYTEGKQCLSCPRQCTQCNNYTYCISCKTNYFLYNQNNSVSLCAAICPLTTFQRQRRCQKCSNLCLGCAYSQNNCTSCSNGMLLEDSICVNQCSQYYYANSKNCQRCSQWCIHCIDKNNCKKCQSSYLYQGKCILNCPSGTYKDSLNSLCKQCSSEHCLQCTNQLICTKCSFQYALFHIQCISKPCRSDLYYYSSNNQCLNVEKCEQNGLMIYHKLKQCFNMCPSYLINKQNLCVDQCGIEQFVNQNVSCQKGYSSLRFKTKLIINSDGLQILLIFSENVLTEIIPKGTDFSIQISDSITTTNRLLQSSQILQPVVTKYTKNSLTLKISGNNFSRRKYKSLQAKVMLNKPYRSYLYNNIPQQNFYDIVSIDTYTIYDYDVGGLVLGVLIMIASIIISIIMLWITWKPHLLIPIFDFMQILFLFAFLNIQYQPQMQSFFCSFTGIHLRWFRIYPQQLVLSPLKYYSVIYDINWISNILSNIVLAIVCCIVLGLAHSIRNIYPKIKSFIERNAQSCIFCLIWLCIPNILHMSFINVFYKQTPLSFWTILSYLIMVIVFGALLVLNFYLYSSNERNRYFLDEGINQNKIKIVKSLPIFIFLRKVMIIFFLTFYYDSPIYVLILTLILSAVIFAIYFWYQPYQVSLRNKFNLIYQSFLFGFVAFLIIFVMNVQALQIGYGWFIVFLGLATLATAWIYPIHCIYRYFKYQQLVQPVIEVTKQQQQSSSKQIKGASNEMVHHLVKYFPTKLNIADDKQNQADISDQGNQPRSKLVSLQGPLRLVKKQRKIKQFKNYMIEENEYPCSEENDNQINQ